MSAQPYIVTDIHWPTHDQKVTTVQGPGVHHPDIRLMFGEGAPVARLEAFAEALNTAFLIGRRAAQADIRSSLGLTSSGRNVELKS